MTRRRFIAVAVWALACAPAGGASPGVQIARTPVTSTSLASIGYDAASEMLEIEFRSGAIYRYLAVPAAVYRELMSAESKGRFFSQRIRGRYRYHRVTRSTP